MNTFDHGDPRNKTDFFVFFNGRPCIAAIWEKKVNILIKDAYISGYPCED